MRIHIDTREAKPLDFALDSILTDTVSSCLQVGDYQAEYLSGYRSPLIFERKSLPDLFSTMTAGYARFKRELTKAADLHIQLVLIVEGSLADVYAGIPHSTFAGRSCVQKLFTLWVKYDLAPVFCNTRDEMAAYIREAFYAIGRTHQHGQ